MARSAGHEHRWRIVSHTTEKPLRYLLGCACSASVVAKRNQDVSGLEHLCCQPAKQAA